MATKIVNRQTFSVDYDLDDLNLNLFNFTSFKGLCDNRNDVTVDQNSFAYVKNVYVDDNNVLMSRAPLKFRDGETHIVNELYFGQYGIRVYRQLICINSDGTPAEQDGSPVYYKGAEGTTPGYMYTIACFTHDTYEDENGHYGAYQFVYPVVDDVTKLQVPKVTGLQIEDKIFIWFAGQAIIDFNTAGYFVEESQKTLPFFEDAYKYLYIPAHILVTNGFESELEAQNFLTDAYIKRYLYTTESSVDWTQLEGKHVSVYQSDNDARKHLYDIDVGEDASMISRLLTFSVGNVGASAEGNFGGNYSVRVVERDGVPIILRTDTRSFSIQVAYGTEIFHTLPSLGGTIDNCYPELTDDGLYVVCFTDSGIAFCNIIAVDSETSQATLVDNFVWEMQDYAMGHTDEQIVANGKLTGEPAYGRFHTRDEFVYIYGQEGPTLTTRVVIRGKFRYNSRTIYDFYMDDRDVPNDNWTQYMPNVRSDAQREIKIEFHNPRYANDVPSKVNGEFDFSKIGPFIVFNQEGTVYCMNLVSNGQQEYEYCTSYYSYWFDYDTSHDYTVTFTMLSDIKIAYFLTQANDTPANSIEYDVNIAVCSLVSNVYVLRRVFITQTNTSPYTQSITISDDSGKKYMEEFSQPDNTTLYSPGIKFGNSSKIDLLTSRLYFPEIPMVLGGSREGFLGTVDYDKGSYYTLNLSGPNFALYLANDNIYLLHNTDLYTNQLQSGTIIEVDTYENVTFDDDGNMIINFRPDVPDCFSALGDYYISFATIEDGQFRLLMSDTRRDEETNDFLLYLPDTSEQKFSQRITNLHPLADDTMGIFTEDEIWYIQALNLDNENVTRYTKAIKSKLPIGCKNGNDVITADNGQAILFAVPRGIVYLTPEDFVATTDRVIKYITDDIQNTYVDFFFQNVENANAHEFGLQISPMIKATTYSYWILFYRYLDNKMLLLDTRSNTWWKWETPYPIITISGRDNLCILMELELQQNDPNYQFSLCGVSFLYCNRSYNEYQDDVIEDYTDGSYKTETSVHGERITYQFASPTIEWKFVTQKLHFGAINNYKFIRAVNINTNGEGSLITRFTAKAYRDLYHPEQTKVMEIKINDLRTFVKRYNLMHVTNFELSLSSEEGEITEPLSLNSMSIKYEIKGMVR